MYKNEVLIIGSGFSGAVLARELSDNADLPITVIEKRNSVGGNMYDEYDCNGFLIQKYGPHIIYTDNFSVIRYLSRFDEMLPHDCKMLSYIDNKFVQLPYGFKTVQQLYSLEDAAAIISALKDNYPNRKSVTIYELMHSKVEVINRFGRDLYEKGFRPYIAKQWDKTIDEIDESVVNRVQFQLSYVERYLQRDYQFLPKHGFTYLIKRMLASDRVSVRLNTDALQHITFENNKLHYCGDEYRYVFFTGALDELFGCRFGRLPYRSIAFKYEYLDICRALPCEICSFPSEDQKYTRKTEYKFFAPFVNDIKRTIVVTEFPVDYNRLASEGNVQCYPVINKKNSEIYCKYFELAKQICNLRFIGRLANYEYINMDTTIIRAQNLAYEVIREINEKN